ncbi:hypothetical protein PVA19_12725 [Agrobacterium sp. CNPSo 3708]|uniref:hypothetical protein n=1 Tax=Agrobacterium sp. CNPSo 3708 TaxID=3028150 RepID=UPI0023646F64|nr:hypothetical protein [Agrobacterium sp. CNPSo 3708]MDD1499280.1 hypothetical protein [Agrobacterium sp. CNPSo 3708]
MKYRSPEHRTRREITEILSDKKATPDQKISAVLSAVFYGDSVPFAGDVLIKEFETAKYKEKIWLKNIFETFYGMCRTAYRIDESIQLLEEYKDENPHSETNIEETIDALNEYKAMFERM